MKQLFELLQLLSLKQVIETPALLIHREGDHLVPLLEPLMEGVYFSTAEALSGVPGQYRSIIVAEISDHLPLFHKLLEPSGGVYLFTGEPQKVAERLSTEFKLISFYPPGITMGISYGDPLQEFHITGSRGPEKQLLVASNEKLTPPAYRFNIPGELFQSFFKELFIDIDHYNGVVYRYNQLLGDLKTYRDRAESLQKHLDHTRGKQRGIQEGLRRMLQQQQDQIQQQLQEDQLRIQMLQLGDFSENSSPLVELDLGEKLAALQQENTALIVENCRLHYSTLSGSGGGGIDLFQLQKLQQQELLCRKEQEALLRENQELIQQGNEYVSEISHLRFDIENLITERDDLMNSLDQVQQVLDQSEMQLKEEENRVTELLTARFEQEREQFELKLKQQQEQFDAEREQLIQESETLTGKIGELTTALGTLQQYQQQVAQQNHKLTEQRKIIHSLKQELRQKQDTIHEQEMVIDRAKESVTILNNSIQENQQNSSKVEHRYQESKKLLDQRNNTIQKLKFQLERMKSDIDGQEKINQKLNTELQGQKQELTRLKQLEEQFDHDQEQLKTRYNALLAQSNDNYYKNLYDSTEEELQRLQKQLKRASRENRELREEQKRYELKIQELMGYNERMREQLSKLTNK